MSGQEGNFGEHRRLRFRPRETRWLRQGHMTDGWQNPKLKLRS